MPTNTHRIGSAGEDLAASYLRSKGYHVLARGFRTRRGEVDLVAAHDGLLVFVEVKARTGAAFGAPAESVGALKQARIAHAAAAYLAQSAARGEPERACRFDVITIRWDRLGEPIIDHVEDAFRLVGQV